MRGKSWRCSPSNIHEDIQNTKLIEHLEEAEAAALNHHHRCESEALSIKTKWQKGLFLRVHRDGGSVWSFQRQLLWRISLDLLWPMANMIYRTNSTLLDSETVEPFLELCFKPQYKEIWVDLALAFHFHHSPGWTGCKAENKKLINNVSAIRSQKKHKNIEMKGTIHWSIEDYLNNDYMHV